MAESLTDIHKRFAKRYEHLTFEEYRDTDLMLEIPKRLANIDAYNELLKDVTGRAVQIGDILAMGNSQYASVKIGVVVGFTPKAIKIAHFNGYQRLKGLGWTGTFSTGSYFLIVNPKNKPYKEVD